MKTWVLVVAVTALVVVVVVSGHVTGGLGGDLRLVNNGYEGLVVSLSDHIPQEHCSHVVHGLKNVLRELSNQMWSATEGRASLREVTVTLPRAWRTSPALTCSLFTPLLFSSWPSEGHIHVTAPHPGFGSRPWTQQSQGCGRQGDFIQLGGDFLRAAGNDSHVHAARLLLTEWAKFRWGVFDERGHAHDPLYPPTFRDPNTHQWAATGCTDGAVRGRTCDPSQPGCSFSPDLYTNNHLSASLLAFPHLPTVRLFCTDKTHTHVAPTKHNSLCGGRSAWQIIHQTRDFAGGRNPASGSSRSLDPVVRFVQKASPRYVFVVENTATMNLQRRWEYLRKAMRRVVVYDVPDGAHVGVVTFSSLAQTVAPLTVIESQDTDMRQRVGSSLPRNTSPIPETQKCILCGLQEALKVLNANGRRSADGGAVIFITTGSGATPHLDLDKMLHLVTQYHLRMDVVLYPLTERRGAAAAASHALHALVEATRGSVFTVMDEGVGNDSKVKMMVALMDALLAIVQRNAPASSPGAPVLVHNTAYPGGIASMSAGSFALDDSLGPDARFSVYYYDLNHVGNAIQLTAPSGHKIASVNVQEEDGDVNMIFINLESAERGLWTYSVENCADSHQGLYVQVTAKQNSSTGIQVRLWTSAGARLINSSDPSMPVVVYAEVKVGVAPIMNARVVAKIHRLGTNATGSDYQPMFLHLWDNGVGDPDITQGDGVYSRYLPQLPGSPGRYLLSADVDYNNGLAVVAQGPPRRRYKSSSLHLPFFHHHYRDPLSSEETCCGHTLPHVHTRRTPPFLRHLSSGVLEVMSPVPYRDLIPPSRVLDLRVEVNDTVHEISLRWTAPGDDWDVDRAHHYEAVVAPSWEEARAFQGDRLTGLPHPLPAGTLHTTILHFTRYEELWYLSVRAVDEAGNMGGVGNIAALWVPRPPTTYEITTRTQPALTTSGNYTVTSELGSGRPLGIAELRLEDVALILGGLGGLVLVLGVLVSYCYCYIVNRRKRRDQKDGDKVESGSSCSDSATVVKSGSITVEDCGGSQEPLESVMKNAPEVTQDAQPLSSVHPWGNTTQLPGYEHPLSVHSEAAEDRLVAYQVEGAPLNAPFPDVTVTHYGPAVSGSGGGEPSVYLPPCPGEEAPPCRCTIPGPDYTTYTAAAGAWDEPLTSRLFTRACTTGAAPTAVHHHHLPQGDRRNVTQV